MLRTKRAQLIAYVGTCLCLAAAGQTASPAAADPVPERPAHGAVLSPERAVPSGNLIQNPGAEAGVGGDLPSWQTTPGFFAETYGSEFRPGLEVSAQIGGGASLFAGGSESTVSSGSQVIDVSAAALEIDAGAVNAQLSAFLGGIDDEGDYAEVTAAFLPASGDQPLATVKIGPVTAADRGSVTAFLPRSATRVLPAKTRRILVTIIATREVGIYTDGYADNLSLTMTTRPVSTSIRSIRSPGNTVTGRVRATAPCQVGRAVSVKKGSRSLGSGRTSASGRFTIQTAKHTRGKLTVHVRARTVGSLACTSAKKDVPGRN